MNKPSFTPKIDRAAATAHLKALGFVKGDSVCVTAFYAKDDPRTEDNPETGQKKDKGRKAQKLAFSECERWQADGRGIYVVINQGGHTKDEIIHCRAIFYEHDNLDKEIQAGLWESLGLPQPTLQVDSGGKSIHSYWRVDCSRREWESLQSDLLEYADADRHLKNCNRVMRLAGTWHQDTWQQVKLLNCSGASYSYAELREIIPAQQKIIAEAPPHIFYAGSEAIPLELCLSLSDRAAIESGCGEGGRNTTGAKLARNLIGTEKYLQWFGKPCQGSARSLFDYYCSRCSPPLEKAESNQIWESAEGDNPTPTLSAESINNCIKAWDAKQQGIHSHHHQESQLKLQSSSNESIAAEDDKYDKFLKALQSLATISNQLEQEFRLEQVCKQYHVNVKLGSQIFEGIKSDLPNDKKTSYTVDEIISTPDEALDWVFPGLLPQGELAMIGGQPKTGKSYLGVYETALAVASGGRFLGIPCKQGKVLIYQLEESIGSIKRRMWQRGYGDLALGNTVIVETEFSMLNLEKVEADIVRYQPTLVIVDSLRAALMESTASPNSSEYARPLRRYQKLLMRHNTAGLIIHHAKKDDGYSKGINKMADTLDLTAAVWGIWLLEKEDQNNPKNPKRKLSITPREGEGAVYDIMLNVDENSRRWQWSLIGEDGVDEHLLRLENYIIAFLAAIAPHGLTKGEITGEILDSAEYRHLSSSVPRALNRLTDRQILSHRPATTSSGGWVYAMPDRLIAQAEQLARPVDSWD